MALKGLSDRCRKITFSGHNTLYINMLFYLLGFVYLADKLINNSRYLFYTFKHLFKTSMDLNVKCSPIYTAEDFKLWYRIISAWVGQPFSSSQELTHQPSSYCHSVVHKILLPNLVFGSASSGFAFALGINQMGIKTYTRAKARVQVKTSLSWRGINQLDTDKSLAIGLATNPPGMSLFSRMPAQIYWNIVAVNKVHGFINCCSLALGAHRSKWPQQRRRYMYIYAKCTPCAWE